MRDKKKLIQNAMDKAFENKEVAGVNLLVIKDGEEQFYAQSGYLDVAAKKPMNRDTIVHLYSQSKPITAAAAMLLVQDGILDLNESVSNYISSFQRPSCLIDGKQKLIPIDKRVRIIDLLNMTSGLVYPGGNTDAEKATSILFTNAIDRLDTDDQMTTLEFAEEIGKLPLQFVPGSGFQYGTSADVLGAVIEKASGMRFGEFLEERFFKPLGMVDTGFYVPEEKKNRLSKVYEVADDDFKEFTGNHLIIRNDGNKNAFESGGAGLFSTLDDYSHFAQMLMNGGTYKGQEILTANTVKFLTSGSLTPSQQQKAFDNWQGFEGYTYRNLMRVMIKPSEAVLMGHVGEYGWDGWLGAYFMNDPEINTTMLMMTQMKDYGTGYLTRKIRNIVMS